MKVKPKHWAWWLAGCAAGFAFLEYQALRDGEPWNTLTGRIRATLDSHPLAKAGVVATWGGMVALGEFHFLHNDGNPRDEVTR